MPCRMTRCWNGCAPRLGELAPRLSRCVRRRRITLSLAQSVIPLTNGPRPDHTVLDKRIALCELDRGVTGRKDRHRALGLRIAESAYAAKNIAVPKGLPPLLMGREQLAGSGEHAV